MLTDLGLQTAAFKTNLGTKTCVVDHPAGMEADKICQALNTKMLGARIIQSGGVTQESTTRCSIVNQLRDPNSSLSCTLLIMQVLGLIAGIVLSRIYNFDKFQIYPFVAVVCLGISLVKQAVRSLLACRMTIQLLMGIVLVGALVLQQWREAATVSLLVCGSEWLLARVHMQVEEAMSKTFVGAVTHATKVTGTVHTDVRIDALQPADVVLLRTGEMVPVDGNVTRSNALKVDESSVSGEALPVEKAVGTAVHSGTIVVGGAGEFECTATQENSFQGRMQSAVDDARNSESATEELVNRIAAYYTPVVILASAVVAVWTQDPMRGLTTLVSACPCALVAAAPPAQSCTLIKLLTELQVLVKNTKGLENVARMNTIAVDKTGTVTTGAFAVVDAAVLPAARDMDKTELLRLLAAVESQDPHPLATCVVNAHIIESGFTFGQGACAAAFTEQAQVAQLPKVSRFTRVESMGVFGVVEGKVVGAGSTKYLESQNMDVPEEAKLAVNGWEACFGEFTTIYMNLEDECVMVLCLQDRVRPDASAAIKQLLHMGVRPSLLTGDTERPARAVAETVGIPEVHFSLKPEDKEAWVRAQRDHARADGQLRWTQPGDALEAGQLTSPFIDKRGTQLLERERRWRCCGRRRVVGMLGDGLNDGPALAAADIGIAISAGLQLTLDAADVVVNKGDNLLTRLSCAVKCAKACRAIVVQNLCLGGLLKGAAIVLACTGVIGLSTGVLADTGSFLVVLASSLRPLCWKLTARVEAVSPATEQRTQGSRSHNQAAGGAASADTARVEAVSPQAPAATEQRTQGSCSHNQTAGRVASADGPNE